MFRKIVLCLVVVVSVAYGFYHSYYNGKAYWSNAANNIKVITTDRR